MIDSVVDYMKKKTLLCLSLIFCVLLSTTSCSRNVARPIVDEAEIDCGLILSVIGVMKRL